MSFAHAVIHGHLGNTPTTRAAGATTVTTLSVAVTRRFKRNNEKCEATTWWRCTIWGQRGLDAQKYLNKGMAVIVHGWPEIRQYTDDQQIQRFSTELIHADWSFAAPKGDVPAAPEGPPPRDGATGTLTADQQASAAAAFGESGELPSPRPLPPPKGDDEPPF